MKIDPNAYRKTLDALRPKLLEARDKGQDLHAVVVELSVASHIPIQAMVSYAMRDDVLGVTPVLHHLDVTNRAFYHYDYVTPWKDL